MLTIFDRIEKHVPSLEPWRILFTRSCSPARTFPATSAKSSQLLTCHVLSTLVKTHMPTCSNGIPGESELMCGDNGEWQGWWLSVAVKATVSSASIETIGNVTTTFWGGFLLLVCERNPILIPADTTACGFLDFWVIQLLSSENFPPPPWRKYNKISRDVWPARWQIPTCSKRCHFKQIKPGPDSSGYNICRVVRS